MPVPSSIDELSPSAGSNYPSGSDSPSTLDNTARAHAAFIAQLRDRSCPLSSVSGTNTITASASSGMVAYSTGQRFNFVAAGANTGAVTLNVNSIGAKDVQFGTTALSSGDIPSGAVVEVVYDGTRFQVVSISGRVAGNSGRIGGQLSVTGRIITGGSSLQGAEAGSVTVSAGSSGVASAATGGDDLIVENDASGGISVLGPNTSTGVFWFGDPEQNDVGGIFYSHSNNNLAFRTNGVTAGSFNDSGVFFCLPSYNSTTASASNAYLNGSGGLQRSTSTLTLKTHIEAATYEDALQLMRLSEVIWYRSACEMDRKDISHYGLAAEQVAAINPRFAHWGYRAEDYEDVEVSMGFESAPLMVEEPYEQERFEVVDGVAVRTVVTGTRLVQKIENLPVFDADGNQVFVSDGEGKQVPLLYPHKVTQQVERFERIRQPKAGAQQVPVGVAYERVYLALMLVVQREVLGIDRNNQVTPELQKLIDEYCPEVTGQ